MTVYPKTIHKLISSSAAYIGASILRRSISFLLLPVLTRFIAPFHYGILATFQALYPIGVSFVDMGSATAVGRHTFDTHKTNESLGRYIFNSVIIKLFFLFILFTVLISMRTCLGEKSGLPFWLVIIIPGLAFASAFILTVANLWIVQKKAYTYSLFQCSRAFLNMAISVVLVVIVGLSWAGRIWGIVIVEFLFMIGCLLYLLRKKLLIFKFDLPIIKETLKFGAPLFIYGIGRWTINLVDRFYLNMMTDVSVTGIYSVGYSVASVVEFIAGGVGFAVMPILFTKLKNPTDSQKRTIVRYTYLYFFSLFCITLVWILAAPFFMNIFVGRNFIQATRYISWISFACFINAIYRIFSIYITYSKKTYYLTYAVIAAAVVNVILNYVLIKANGPIGAAQSTLISYAVCLILAFIFTQKVYPMPWLSFVKR